MNTYELRLNAIRQINAEVIRLIDLFNDKTGRKISYPCVRHDGVGTSAGTASKTYVRFNVDMAIMKGNWVKFQNTVSHEIAHYIDFNIRGTSKHDAKWRNIHIFLGGNGLRTHSMISKSRLKEYIYDVNGHGIVLSAIRHKKIQQNNGVYRCKFGIIDVSCTYKIKEYNIALESELIGWTK